MLRESSTALSRSSASNLAACCGGHELRPARGRGVDGGDGGARGPTICDGRPSSARDASEESEDETAAIDEAGIMEIRGATGGEEQRIGTLTKWMDDERFDWRPAEVADADDGRVVEGY